MKIIRSNINRWVDRWLKRTLICMKRKHDAIRYTFTLLTNYDLEN